MKVNANKIYSYPEFKTSIKSGSKFNEVLKAGDNFKMLIEKTDKNNGNYISGTENKFSQESAKEKTFFPGKIIDRRI